MTRPVDVNRAGKFVRADLVQRVAERIGDRRAADQLVATTLDLCREALAEEGQLALRGFGRFQVVQRAARAARNPKTGEPAAVQPHAAIVFRPSQALKNAMTLALSEGR